MANKEPETAGEVDIDRLEAELLADVDVADGLEALERIRVGALGKKGRITALTKSLGQLDPEARRAAGQRYNQAKQVVSEAITARRETLEAKALDAQLMTETIDVTQPIRPEQMGRIHPVSQVTEELIAIFGEMGFRVAEGPDIEDDFNNFSALNIPPEHPARQMQDTFYLEAEK
ncbi:MAG: phenylalanine--tRNA ligase subunit alpha, partial [Geminicoccaceae bacterium]